MTGPSNTGRQSGALLLEALIAILLFSLGILSLVGMQAAAIGNVSEAKYRSDASFLANQLIGQIWVNRTNIADYAYGGSGAPPTCSPTGSIRSRPRCRARATTCRR